MTRPHDPLPTAPALLRPLAADESIERVKYGEASANLQVWKAAKAVHVCPVCGKTVVAVDCSKRPVCFTPGEQYMKVV